MIRSDKAQILRQTFRRFTEEEVAPRAQAIDEAGELPRDLWEKLGQMGAFGIRYPRDRGGAGGNNTLYCIICEELARGLVSLGAVFAMQGLMGTNFIFRYGTDEHQERYFLPAMRGQVFSAFCLTEPDHSSDLTGCKTTALKEGDNYVINGMKTWITNAPKADFFTVLVQTKPGSKAKGLNFALVDRQAPGLSASKRFQTVGTRSSELGEIAFSDVVIPAQNLLVPEGQGMRALIAILAEIRTMTGALALGLAKAAFEASVKYAKERSQFGRLIKNYQPIQAHVANMAANIYASELMLYDCCAKIDRGQRALNESSMVKYFICETACNAADRATRVMGGYSYSMDYPVQRFFRDSRFLLYGGGTHEILQANIGREILR
ncbi:MAG: acyl-CoA dehydrogenase family protein [Deltaproteobacteria bacterium]|nr:acyl-CoA dehydrogenase family protein [Deltaproteobacteria bacterium]